MAQRLTMADLAREAGVSLSTIDRILSGRGKVKPATLDHVLATAERIGFHAVGSIRSRRDMAVPERTLGFLLNDRARHFYQAFSQQLSSEVAAQTSIQGRAIFSHVTDLDPARMADALLTLGEKCDAVAAVCIDHPRINMAVKDLAARGVPVLPMISDISAPERAGFVGANDWQLGRSAGWFVRRLCPRGGKIALVPGNVRYTCQQSLAASFRGFISEVTTPRFTVIDVPSTEESDLRAEEVVTSLLREHPDLVAIVLSGGGLQGAARALASRGQSERTGPLLIGTEITEKTRALLVEGRIDMILAHPGKDIAREAVRALVRQMEGLDKPQGVQRVLPFEILIGENC
ncbi:LacI family DNA-binding transcriptional regulator [Pseudooceanicola nanhaiensis]|uniref:LacI family DNA-binding transcriptional regulator n=1 Tax=Pseudooceanicola nanhaiensis TaxID=375761 RepID=UPI001CD4B93B|nr:LacI family DNA-binding transcriptional regulator [Pseudooceanicola nanhaiensis]MCA0921942.1 substrate-binding domain-containing protein [Pseudooceanicola nanhaiensis]